MYYCMSGDRDGSGRPREMWRDTSIGRGEKEKLDGTELENEVEEEG